MKELASTLQIRLSQLPSNYNERFPMTVGVLRKALNRKDLPRHPSLGHKVDNSNLAVVSPLLFSYTSCTLTTIQYFGTL